MEPQENVMPIENIEEINDLSFINENTAAVDMIYNPDKTLFCKRRKNAVQNSKRTWYANISRNYCI